MRLTLRTLLAWLDDKLPPAEVREIGKQVTESPFAQELVERIRRVTRQRRLSVPGESGPEGSDPNLVASYIDSELDQDLVPEYEKLCLTSDVHLAEVASVHQILSLIGQKAKVPLEAKDRMYRLIRGRETVSPRKQARPRIRPVEPPAPAGLPQARAETAPKPTDSWTSPGRPSRPWFERYGPGVMVASLLLILGWSTWFILNQGGQSEP